MEEKMIENKIKEWARKYGGLEKIPQKELISSGYVRVNEDGNSEIMPIGEAKRIARETGDIWFYSPLIG